MVCVQRWRRQLLGGGGRRASLRAQEAGGRRAPTSRIGCMGAGIGAGRGCVVRCSGFSVDCVGMQVYEARLRRAVRSPVICPWLSNAHSCPQQPCAGHGHAQEYRACAGGAFGLCRQPKARPSPAWLATTYPPRCTGSSTVARAARLSSAALTVPIALVLSHEPCASPRPPAAPRTAPPPRSPAHRQIRAHTNATGHALGLGRVCALLSGAAQRCVSAGSSRYRIHSDV